MKDVDWSYFETEKGRFAAKKLPPPKSTSVRFKDISDLTSLRDELRDARSFKEGIEAYRYCFGDSFDYEVEVETFIETVQRNRNHFLGGNTFLKHQTDLLIKLNDTYYEDDLGDGEPWIFVAKNEGLKMVDSGLFVACEADKEIWLQFLREKYRVVDLKSLAEGVIKLKGKKDDQLEQLYEVIQEGKIHHEPPFAVLPDECFQDFLVALQAKYVEDIENALAEWTYPEAFAQAIWENVLDENSEWMDVCSEVEKRKMRYTPSPHRFSTRTDANLPLDYDVRVSKEYGSPKQQAITPTTISFKYFDVHENYSSRRIQVSSIWRDDDVVYFQGHCFLRNDQRTFRLDRIHESMLNEDSGEVVFDLNMSLEQLHVFLDPSSGSHSGYAPPTPKYLDENTSVNEEESSPPPGSEHSTCFLAFNYYEHSHVLTPCDVGVTHVWEDKVGVVMYGYCNIRKAKKVIRVDRIRGAIKNKVTGQIGNPHMLRSLSNCCRFLNVAERKKSEVSDKAPESTGKALGCICILTLIPLIASAF